MEKKKTAALFLPMQKRFVFIDEGNSGSEEFSADFFSTVIGMVGNHLCLAVNVNDFIESHPPK